MRSKTREARKRLRQKFLQEHEQIINRVLRKQNLRDMGMIAVKLMHDDSGHVYLIPNELEEKFGKMAYLEGDQESEEFEKEFGRYRTGGSPNLIQLYVEDMYKDRIYKKGG